MSGGNITLGLVFDGSTHTLLQATNSLLNHLLQQYGLQATDFKASLDCDGEEWVEGQVADQPVDQAILTTLVQGHYASLHMKGSLFGLESVEFVVRLEKEDTFFGILIDFALQDLLPDHNSETLTTFESKLADYLVDLFPSTKYDYAFCDHEAELAYHPDDFQNQQEHVYSIIIRRSSTPGASPLLVGKSDWHIDGMTPRESDQA